jgi:hypothetical protein
MLRHVTDLRLAVSDIKGEAGKQGRSGERHRPHGPSDGELLLTGSKTAVMSDFDNYLTADARLVILRELNQQTDGRLNEALLTKTLDAFGHNRSREWVRTQLRKLAELGAVKVTEVGNIMVAAITRNGVDHVERRTIIEGVARPSPEA